MSETPERWTIEQLQDGIQVPLADPAGTRPTIRCTRLERTASDQGDLVVDLDIVSSGQPEHWRLTFDAMWTELSRMPLDAAVLVLRANIEEWWDLRLREPDPPYRTVERIG